MDARDYRGKLNNSICIAVVMIATIAMTSVEWRPANASVPNADPNSVSFYNWNVHLQDNNWRGLLQFIADSPSLPTPDVFLLQDVQNETQRLAFRDEMKRLWPNDTWYTRGSGTGYHWAIIWRAGRFSNATSRTFAVYGKKDGLPCEFGGGGSDAIQLRIYDELKGAWVSAVSFKTSPLGDDVTCAWKNLKRVTSKLQESGWSGSLLVLGTDANAPDRTGDAASSWTCWYNGANGDRGTTGCGGDANRGFRDPVYSSCLVQGESCFNSNDTHGTNRIDFLLGKLGSGAMPAVVSQNPLPFGRNADGSYCYSTSCNTIFSDHRAIQAVFSHSAT